MCPFLQLPRKAAAWVTPGPGASRAAGFALPAGCSAGAAGGAELSAAAVPPCAARWRSAAGAAPQPWGGGGAERQRRAARPRSGLLRAWLRGPKLTSLYLFIFIFFIVKNPGWRRRGMYLAKGIWMLTIFPQPRVLRAARTRSFGSAPLFSAAERSRARAAPSRGKAGHLCAFFELF